MTALGSWLKQLVLIVLFAVFAEMLLPTRALEKYIRMVLGLALIATMLQPLGLLLQRNWAASVANDAIAELTGTLGSNNGDTPATSENESSGALKQTLQQDELQETNRLLAQRISAGIAASYGFTPREVTISGSAAKGTLQVHVTISAAQQSRASPIQKWIASELGINATRVVVNSGGGG